MKGLPSMVQIVGDKNMANFSYLKLDHMFYNIVVPMFGMYQFPIPLNERDDATWKNTMSAIILMRWIRKALEDKTFVCIQATINNKEAVGGY